MATQPSAPPLCANPLLATFLTTWHQTALSRSSKGAPVYKKALDSLLACPITFAHPSEASVLQGIGDKLCSRLTSALEAHCRENGLPPPQKPRRRVSLPQGSIREEYEAELAATEKEGKRKRRPAPYVPRLRSGAYALLLGLAVASEASGGYKGGKRGLTKAELIEVAQPLCDSDFKVPSDPGKFYTAWKSIDTLKDKDLVAKRGRPTKRYELTEEGWEVARRIQTAEAGGSKVGSPAKKRKKGEDGASAQRGTTFRRPRTTFDPDLSPVSNLSPPRPPHSQHSPSPSPQRPARPRQSLPLIPGTALPYFAPLIYPPHSFKIHLYLDTREVRAKHDRDYIQTELSRLHCPVETHALTIGDCQWVAVPNANCCGPDGQPLPMTPIALPHILERKRLDDLIASIREGRFHEQKHRLRKLRPLIPAASVVYLVEHCTLSPELKDRYAETMESALRTSEIVDGFFVKRTKSLGESIRYLAGMTEWVRNRYEGCELRVLPEGMVEFENWGPLMERLREKGLPGYPNQPSASLPSTARSPASAAGAAAIFRSMSSATQDLRILWTVSTELLSSLGSKADQEQLRDVYLKMLTCSRGLSVEKAVQVMKVWPTPRALVEAYREVGRGMEKTEREKAMKEMVSLQTGGLIARKKIPKPVSAKMAEVWGGLKV